MTLILAGAPSQERRPNVEMLTKCSLPSDRLGVDEGGKETRSGELDEDDTEEEHNL